MVDACVFDAFAPGDFELRDPSTIDKSTLRRCRETCPAGGAPMLPCGAEHMPMCVVPSQIRFEPLSEDCHQRRGLPAQCRFAYCQRNRCRTGRLQVTCVHWTALAVPAFTLLFLASPAVLSVCSLVP